jgi:putative ABC transport system permease protein
LHDALREVGRNVGTSPGRQRFRRLLVVTQISMAMVLVIGATLLIKSFWHLRNVNPGFNPDHVAVMNLTLPQSKYREWHQISAFYDRLLEQIRSMPGVRSASIAYDQPLASNWIDSFTIAGRPEAEPGQKLSECFRPVGDDYFLSLSIELLKGRPFTKQDDPSHPGVTIINDAFARKYFPNENPLGQQIESSTPSRMSNGPMPTSFEIVGVVRDTKFQGLSADTVPAFYIPAKQFPLSDMVVMARVEGDPLTYSQPLRDAVRSLDRDQPINPITSMETILAEDISQPRFNMLLMGLFGALALVLALIGIYGLLSYAVAQRTQEIGLRMALGAQAQDVLKLVVGQGMRLVVLGVAIGLAAALLLTRVMRSLLFGVTATDAQTFGSTVLIMAAVAFLACMLPALRATKVDPNVALRYE